jgi:hypothetical protein
VLTSRTGADVLFAGDDWPEENHDVELMDASGRTLARVRLKEGAAGMSRLHAMIGEHAGDGTSRQCGSGSRPTGACG